MVMKAMKSELTTFDSWVKLSSLLKFDGQPWELIN